MADFSLETTSKLVKGDSIAKLIEPYAMLSRRMLIQVRKCPFYLRENSITLFSCFASMLLQLENPLFFLNFWADKPNFFEVVKDVWQTRVPGHLRYQIKYKLNILKRSMRKHFHHTPLHETLCKVEAEFATIQETLHGDPNNADVVNKEIDCMHRLKTLKMELVSMVQQSAKVNQLKYGDENTAFFHNSIEHRASHNKINTLVIDEDTISNPLLIKKVFLSFFTNFLCHDMKDQKRINIKCIHTGPTLSSNMHTCLNMSFSKEKIKDAMWSINDNKALGIDGYNNKFYKAA